MNRLAQFALKQGATRRALASLAEHPSTFRWLNRLSHPQSVFPDIDAAWKACRETGSADHHDTHLINSNFHLSVQRRISDYPVLFWLQRIAAQTRLRIFDFGGGMGQSFYQYREALPADSIEDWLVMDLPDVAEQGKRYAEEHNAHNLRFTSHLSDCDGHNIFLAAGALHYWERGMADLGTELGQWPEHVIINRSPLRKDGPPYVTIQTPGAWRVPCIVRTVQQLKEEFQELDFDLADHWNVPEKTLAPLLLPQYEAPYAGMYFRRRS